MCRRNTREEKKKTTMAQSGILARVRERERERLAKTDYEGRETDEWINQLPDGILSSILSCLTIKDAVDTSLVSRHWSHQWLHPILTRADLQFDIANIFGSRCAAHVGSYCKSELGKHLLLMKQYEPRDFVSRVNTFLRLYRGDKVNSFKVSFLLDGESSEALDDWIRFAITKGVEVLHLNLQFLRTRNLYVFPHQLLSELNASATLKHLSLSICVLRPPPGFDGFNRLTTLCLDSVRVDETFMAHLLSVCLLLEILSLTESRVGSSLIVAHPLFRLKNLKVRFCPGLSEIQISAAPNLVSFEYAGNANVSVTKTPQLASIYFRARSNATLDYALTHFASSPRLHSLHLYLHDSVGLPQNLSTFRNLTQLDLDLSMTRRTAEIDLLLVLEFLKATPLLEELVITEDGPRIPQNQQDVRNIPVFSHEHLRKVKIQGFQSCPYEIGFAVCLLKGTIKLEEMVIDPFGKIYMDEEWADLMSIYGPSTWCGREVPESSWAERWKASWEENGRAVAQEKLNQVKTDARIIIL